MKLSKVFLMERKVSMSKQSHLTLEERQIIEKGIREGSSKKAMADVIGKDPSTIAKEIRNHRQQRLNTSNFFNSDCIHLSNKCQKCSSYCSEYQMKPCKRRDRTPGACNGCPKATRCRKTKLDYNAKKAQQEYEDTLSDSRMGINYTTKEFNEMAKVIVPLINKNQSPYHIAQTHPELGVCEKTIYNHITWGYYGTYNITDSSLRRKVKYRTSKDKRLKKRKDNSCFMGRTYQDYLNFIEDRKIKDIPQMDTVYNDAENGPFLQTFHLTNCDLFFAILHQKKDAASMTEGVNQLKRKLGKEIFCSLFPALLTDRGTEFSNAVGIETGLDNEKWFPLFYCDPMHSCQKAQIEREHSDIRTIIPKGISLNHLTQEKVDLMCSHVNSYARESLNGKSPYEMFEFLYNKKILDTLNIQKIPSDQINLTPQLLK